MLLALLLALAAHPDSVSSTRIEVEGTQARLALRSEERTFLEAVAVDRDGDERLSAAELRAGSWALADYVREHYRVEALRAGAAAAPCELEFSGVSALENEGGLLAGKRALELRFRLLLPEACEGLRVHSELFAEANPLHRDQCEIAWNGAEPATKLLWVEDPEWTFRAAGTRPSVVREFLGLGIEHILTGFDHLAFLLALVVASRALRSLVGVVSAFTLAHSVSLACAALGWVVPPARIVEVVIALSIVFVALRNLFEREPRRLWPEAFGFGLVHGLGFAGALAETLSAEPQKLRALLGFNLGVEAGQLAVVCCAVALLWMLRRVARARTAERLAPAGVRFATSLLVALLGSYWAVSRAW